MEGYCWFRVKNCLYGHFDIRFLSKVNEPFMSMATTVLFMALIRALKLDQVLDGVGVIGNLNFTVN